MVLCDDFVKFDVQTNLKYSRDNSKVSTVLHSALFTAFGLFFLSESLLKAGVVYHLENYSEKSGWKVNGT